MKKYFLLASLVGLFLTTNVKAQEANSEEFTKWIIDLNVSAFDFYSPKNDKFSSFKENMAIGPDFSLTRQWSKTGLGITANIASPSISFLQDADGKSTVNRYLAFAGPGLAYNFQNQYLIKSKSPVAPFVFANAMASVAQLDDKGGDVKFGFGIPVGAGVRFKVADKVGLNLKAGYSFGITEYYESNIFWSAGVSLGMNKKSIEEEAVLFVPVDTDGDGIPDELDECPDEAGLAEFNGCPDTDGDGIADKDDECPDVFGLAEFNGCPDTDGDGIPDHKDECPEVAGLAKFNGCPDTDGDGVPDHKDECPEVAGPIENKGCPFEEVKVDDVQKGIQSVHFETGKAELSAISYPILDRVVALLTDNPNFNISIEGHTDNTGTDTINDNLSLERANSCSEYIISKGIEADRVSSVGFGSKNPIADNNTVEGRAENRRTIFKLLLAN
ncbi:MAG TPA: OmpA family protein [Chitinophagales bacterium]|nr:OmpA family protein [Chitinophagales bacterium]